ncbi:type I-D CRISPR-associated protein Cas5/Csc1 [Spirulina sp. 06S082]|uniref:type I-D CRISPR-associated protein Cas5/Csc1 n=1 Tax=Spirulina sp. 06S082 TaxID=3110248 RepID=UPI002B21335B|nr:type I-D CRISPR-associated protein Cas5/Csc1 [Spirulina sp. 06S082]MEA5472500.1 type I-D CRISPR-associated protein Cas5/Csc1 [Spirulina sp. 06S082]
MIIYCCTLTLHDNVFFATREMGLLYETEKYLHNWALSYALFSVTHIPLPYRLQGVFAQKPAYLDRDREQNLLTLNNAGIYVFPAKPLHWSYQVNTFKAAQTTYYGRSKQFGGKGAELNYPINYGRAKELAVGSEYRTYIIATKPIEPFPRWIRLGKWAAKIEMEVKPVEEMEARSGLYLCQHPLNPLDLPSSSQLRLYNRIVMPPVSLVSEAQLEGDYWELEGANLPRGMAYGAGEVAHVS